LQQYQGVVDFKQLESPPAGLERLGGLKQRLNKVRLKQVGSDHKSKKGEANMAHEIFGERFFGKQRKPAWHGLGMTFDISMNAVQAFDAIGAYDIHAEKVYRANGQTVQAQAIVREATAKGEPEAVLGIVGADYVPVSPRTVCEIYDAKISRDVETIGCLRNGSTIFVSTKLPTIDVKGDEIEMYILVVNPMGGDEAMQIRVTPVRVVCGNTLTMAQSMSSQLFRIRHDINAEANLGGWLGGVMGKAESQVAMMKDALNILADYRVDEKTAKAVLSETYSEPNMPRNTAPIEVMKKRYEHREYLSERRAVSREEVMKLFNGAGTGMASIESAGTGYGLYNAICEYEDCAWSKNPISALESTVFGDRADTKVKGFETLMELAKV